MLIEMHVIQNHAPANLNRDDLGAPKTCYFGGVLRSRISSQCLKRSIRWSDEFRSLRGGVRTRQLARLIAKEAAGGDERARKRVEKILDLAGFKEKKKKGGSDDASADDAGKSKMLIFTTREAIGEMAKRLKNGDGKPDEALAREFAEIICERVAAPDVALSGRMLEPDMSSKASEAVWKRLNTTVEAALQVAHAISTHEARPMVDYYVAADDIPGEDAGAGYLDEAMFASACFYKYFSIDWDQLVKNLSGFPGNREHLAAHTVGAFLRAALCTNPTGKQNSFAAHCRPDGVLVELRTSPVSYANAFAAPVERREREIVDLSIAQLGQYAHDLDVGFGGPHERFWFSPNLRYLPTIRQGKEEAPFVDRQKAFASLHDLVVAVIRALGHDWEAVQHVVIARGATS